MQLGIQPEEENQAGAYIWVQPLHATTRTTTTTTTNTTTTKRERMLTWDGISMTLGEVTKNIHGPYSLGWVGSGCTMTKWPKKENEAMELTVTFPPSFKFANVFTKNGRKNENEIEK